MIDADANKPEKDDSEELKKSLKSFKPALTAKALLNLYGFTGITSVQYAKML